MKFFTRKKSIENQQINNKSPLLKRKAGVVIPLIATLLMFSTTTVFATNQDFTSITTGINNLGDTIKGFGLPICTVAVVVGGIMLMLGQQIREKAKYVIGSAAIGLIIVNFAEPIANMINSF